MIKEDLIDILRSAYESDHDFFGVAISIPDCDDYEFIINPLSNLENKMAYYEAAYDENLCLKSNKKIKIVYAASNVSHQELMDDLFSSI